MRALGVALMVMAGTVQGAETHRMWVERGWLARDAGRSRECARAFAEATHAAVKEQADQEAIARARILDGALRQGRRGEGVESLEQVGADALPGELPRTAARGATA